MDDFKRILVVTRSMKHCRKAVHYGVSLAQRYGAELCVMHVMHDPFGLEGWFLPIPSLRILEESYRKVQLEAKADMDKIIALEKGRGMKIKELIRQGSFADEIFKVVEEEKIDLIVMLSHEEGRIEHFLYGHDNDKVIRRMPCSILLVKEKLF